MPAPHNLTLAFRNVPKFQGAVFKYEVIQPREYDKPYANFKAILRTTTGWGPEDAKDVVFFDPAKGTIEIAIEKSGLNANLTTIVPVT